MPVYLIRAGDTEMVKIGVATKPEARRIELQTGHWETLQIIRVIDGQLREERWLQQYFAARRVRREWYRFCDEMLTIELPDVAALAAEATARKAAEARTRQTARWEAAATARALHPRQDHVGVEPFNPFADPDWRKSLWFPELLPRRSRKPTAPT